MQQPKKVLVTGAAGFIGSFVIERLLQDGVAEIVGIDNFNNYYTPQLKRDRIAKITDSRFKLAEVDFADEQQVGEIFNQYQFDCVIHLGAQAGVRYSLENPRAYVDSNLVGFVNILEACRAQNTPHLLYASSSSVYGNAQTFPYSESQSTNHPVSLYAATKKSNELMAHTYSHLYGMPTTGLRFFTVYGPWGRPDMAYFSFTKAILAGESIRVFNHGKLRRDFTYIDDIVDGIVKVMLAPPKTNKNWDSVLADPGSSNAPYRVVNIGNNQPVALMDFINTLEDALGTKAKLEFVDHQPGDVYATAADIDRLQSITGFKPDTLLAEGLRQFVKWYKSYYR